MSTQITVAFVQQFKNQVIELSQQKGSRLRDTVISETVVGKTAYFERIGKVAMVQATSRHDDTPQIDTPHSRRKVDLATYRWADLIDNADKVRMLIDPQSPYATVGMYAAGRTMDSVLLTAMNGTAYSGETGATTVALPSAQKIAAEHALKFNAEARRAEVAEREGARVSGLLSEAEVRAEQARLKVAELETEIEAMRAELISWKARSAKTA